MKFNTKTSFWEYQSPIVGSGDTIWGYWDYITNHEQLSIIEHIANHRIPIDLPIGTLEKLNSLAYFAGNAQRNSTSSFYGYKYYGNKAYPKYVNVSGSVFDLTSKQVINNSVLKYELYLGPIGMYVQEDRTRNLFFNTISNFQNSSDRINSFVTSVSGGLIDIYKESNNLPSSGTLSYRYDASISGIILSWENNIIDTGYVVVNDNFDSSKYPYQTVSFSLGPSLLFSSGYLNNSKHGWESLVPLHFDIHGVIGNSPITKCHCDHGFDNGLLTICKNCFGQGYLGLTPGQLTLKKFDPPKRLPVNSKIDRVVDLFPNNLIGKNAGKSFVHMVSSNNVEININILNSIFGSYSCDQRANVESLDWCMNTIASGWNDFKIGNVFSNPKDRMGLADDEEFNTYYDDIIKYNFASGVVGKGDWPASGLGYTPISKKHYKPIANAFTRLYFYYYDEAMDKVVSNSIIDSIRSNDPFETNFTVINSGVPINLKGHYLSKTYLYNLSFGLPISSPVSVSPKRKGSRFYPGLFEFMEINHGDEASLVSMRKSTPGLLTLNSKQGGIGYYLKNDGVIYSQLNASGLFDPSNVITFVSGTNNDFSSLPNGRIGNHNIFCKSDNILVTKTINDTDELVMKSIIASGVSDIVPIVCDPYVSKFHAPHPMYVANTTNGVVLGRINMGDIYTIGELDYSDNSNNGHRIFIGKASGYIGPDDNDSSLCYQSTIDSLDDDNYNLQLSNIISKPKGFNYSYNHLWDIIVNPDDNNVWAITAKGIVDINFNKKCLTKYVWNNFDSNLAPLIFGGRDSTSYQDYNIGSFYYPLDDEKYLFIRPTSSSGSLRLFKIDITHSPTSGNYASLVSVSNFVPSGVIKFRNDLATNRIITYGGSGFVYQNSFSDKVKSGPNTFMSDSTEYINAYYGDDPSLKVEITNIENEPLFHSTVSMLSSNSLKLNYPNIKKIIHNAFVFFEKGATIPINGNVTFLISHADDFRSDMPFFGPTYAISDGTYLYNKTVFDDITVGKVESRCKNDISSMMPALTALSVPYKYSRFPRVLNTYHCPIILKNDSLESGLYPSHDIIKINQEGLENPIYDPFVTNSFLEIKNGDRIATLRGRTKLIFDRMGSSTIKDSFTSLDIGYYPEDFYNVSSLMSGVYNCKIERVSDTTYNITIPFEESWQFEPNLYKFFGISDNLSFYSTTAFNNNVATNIKINGSGLLSTSGFYDILANIYLIPDENNSRMSVSTPVPYYKNGIKWNFYSTNSYQAPTSGDLKTEESIDYAENNRSSVEAFGPYISTNGISFFSNANTDIPRSIQSSSEGFRLNNKFSQAPMIISNFMSFDANVLWRSNGTNTLLAVDPYTGEDLDITKTISGVSTIKAACLFAGLNIGGIVVAHKDNTINMIDPMGNSQLSAYGSYENPIELLSVRDNRLSPSQITLATSGIYSSGYLQNTVDYFEFHNNYNPYIIAKSVVLSDSEINSIMMSILGIIGYKPNSWTFDGVGSNTFYSMINDSTTPYSSGSTICYDYTYDPPSGTTVYWTNNQQHSYLFKISSNGSSVSSSYSLMGTIQNNFIDCTTGYADEGDVVSPFDGYFSPSNQDGIYVLNKFTYSTSNRIASFIMVDDVDANTEVSNIYTQSTPFAFRSVNSVAGIVSSNRTSMSVHYGFISLPENPELDPTSYEDDKVINGNGAEIWSASFTSNDDEDLLLDTINNRYSDFNVNINNFVGPTVISSGLSTSPYLSVATLLGTNAIYYDGSTILADSDIKFTSHAPNAPYLFYKQPGLI